MVDDRIQPVSAPFAVDVELANDTDVVLATAGKLLEQQVRRTRTRAIVGTRATRLVISEAIATHLGLEITGSTSVRYADGGTAERQIAQRLRLSYGGRESVFNAVIEPGRESVLIGAIVLEDLDFLVDCIGQRLVPRDPKQIISEVE
jgi:hypothetical protein